jgi:hypothetical protein
MVRKLLTESEYLKYAIKATGAYIRNKYDIDPMTIKDKSKARWTVIEGSAHCFIEFYFNNQGDLIFGVSSPIVYVPENNKEECFKYLLEANSSKFVLSSFEIKGDKIFLRHTRHVKEIDESEIIFALDELSKRADEFDNLLKEKFNCTMCGKDPDDENS